MSEPMDAKALNPEDLFGDIMQYVEQAHAIMARGEWVELYGLDARVETLCHVIAQMSEAQAKEYAPELEYVRKQIIQLGTQMEVLYKNLGAELKETNNYARANRAYAQSNNLKDPTLES